MNNLPFHSRRQCDILHVLGIVALVLLPQSGLTAAPGNTPAVGDTFPSLAAFELEGTVPALDDAKVVIVDFWASWCGPCKASFPCYEALRQQFGKQHVVIIAVNVDQDPKAMAAFLARHQPGFTVVRDAGQRLVAAVAPPTMPTAFVLDGRGVVRAVHRGFHGEKSQQELVAQITQLLEEQS